MNKKLLNSVMTEFNNNNFEKALINLNQFSSEVNNWQNEYILRAKIFLKLNDYEKAKLEYEKSIKKGFMIAEANLGVGSIEYHRENYKAALLAFEKSIKIKELEKTWIHIGILYRDGNGVEQNRDKAIECFHKSVIASKQKSFLGYMFSGEILVNEGHYHEAIKQYLIPFMNGENEFKLDPDNTNYLFFIIRILEAMNKMVTEGEILNNTLISILEQTLLIKKDARYKNIANKIPNRIFRSATAQAILIRVREIISMGFLLKNIDPKDLRIEIHPDIEPVEIDTLNLKDLLENKKVMKKLNSTAVIEGLRQFRIGTSVSELFFIEIRKIFLSEAIKNYENFIKNNSYESILKSLALQCLENEYIWKITDQEKEDLENFYKIILNQSKEAIISNNEIFILSSYKKLIDYEGLREHLRDEIYENNLGEFFKLQFKNFEIEKEIKKSIKSIGKIKNKISINVQSQYEEFPYPRWVDEGLESYVMDSYFDRIKNDVFPNIINKKTPIKKVLIAGCGTGYQALMSAKTDKNAIIYALDISKESLSYGKRMADMYQIKNINWFHGDILNLNEFNEIFDVIECTGVLHHMENPQKAIYSLDKKLAKNGFFKIALYAKKYRELLKPEKNLIKQNNFKTNINDVRKARELLMEKGLKQHFASFFLNDFYSTSDFIDLLMHHHELSFSIQDLYNLYKNKYEFLGFVFSDKKIKYLYNKKFPEDSKMLNLKNWDIYENENPSLFTSMYQFWLQKN